MSKFIKTAVVIASLFVSGTALANDCGDLLFYGQTANHKKEVRVCAFSQNGKNFAQYRFGKIGQKPELEIIKTGKDVVIDAEKRDMKSLDINNGKITYTLASGMSDDGVMFADLWVHIPGKDTVTIKLDPTTVENNIWRDNTEYGFYSLGDFEPDFNPQVRLAPGLTK